MESPEGQSHASEEQIREAWPAVLEQLPEMLRMFDEQAIRLVGGRSELLQRVSADALASSPKCPPPPALHGCLRAWVTVIAKHKHTDMVREAIRLTHRAEQDVLEQAEQDDFTASRALAHEEGIANLNNCLLKLSPDDRALLLRRYRDDATGNQVAAEAGMSVDALDHRLRKIKRALRDCWGSSGAYRFMAGGH